MPKKTPAARYAAKGQKGKARPATRPLSGSSTGETMSDRAGVGTLTPPSAMGRVNRSMRSMARRGIQPIVSTIDATLVRRDLRVTAIMAVTVVVLYTVLHFVLPLLHI